MRIRNLGPRHPELQDQLFLFCLFTYSFANNFAPPNPVFDWLILCCRNLILQLKNKNKIIKTQILLCKTTKNAKKSRWKHKVGFFHFELVPLSRDLMWSGIIFQTNTLFSNNINDLINESYQRRSSDVNQKLYPKISAFYHLNGHRTHNEITHFNVLRCMFIKDDECVVCGF